jgi:hypothetical protein
MHETMTPKTHANGDESHPAFGMIGASRVSVAGGLHNGSVLFDSDVAHQQLIRVTLSRAVRKRDGMQDRTHAIRELFEVDMSMAQWASFVSSMNVGDGVPCTIRRTETDRDVPGLEHAPRLAVSMQETRDAARDAFAFIKAARDAYEATPSSPAKAKKEALSKLHYAIENAAPNVDYAGKVLVEHTENVVQRARADVEAMVVSKAAQLGLDPATVASPLAIASPEE